MSNPIESFESLLKKKCTNTIPGLYKNTKLSIKQADKPADVIKSVTCELRAIQASETQSNRKVNKDLTKYRKSCFLSVNELPVYQEVTKHHTSRFDTQCVSDTQLINIIEDAELIENQIGMIDEFETSFRHKNTDKLSNEENIVEHTDKLLEDKETSVSIVQSHSKNILDDNTNGNFNIFSKIENKFDGVSTLSTLNNEGSLTSNDKKVQVDECVSHILDECIEIDIDDDIEADDSSKRFPSPVLNYKKVISKSKTPSPLVFNLDAFEKFENFALTMLESHDIEKAAHVINSQILEKELHVITDVAIELNEIQLSPVLNIKARLNNFQIKQNNKSMSVKNFDNLTLLDNGDSLEDQIKRKVKDTKYNISKVNDESVTLKVINDSVVFEEKPCKNNSNFLKDEILFSSDEEDESVNKACDIPFTCALETSLYEHSDVLDKTMYVGFQTASNRSIQICTESLVKATSILSDVTNEDMALADMVKLCDSNNKHAGVEKSSKTILQTEENSKSSVKENDAKETTDSVLKSNNYSNGFKTVNNKEIKLSEKALARCKEVFQDIYYDDKYEFKSTTKGTNPNKLNVNSNIDSIGKKYSPDDVTAKNEEQNNCWEDLIQTNLNDDIIIQEFANIEMSLEEDKVTNRETDVLEFKTASNKSMITSDGAVAKTKNIFPDLDLNKEINDDNLDGPYNLQNNNVVNMTSLNDFAGSKTASNKQIKISENALTKTKDIFQDIDYKNYEELENIGCSKVAPRHKLDNSNINTNNILNNGCLTKKDFDYSSISSTGFVGFKTGSNKEIKISGSSLAKVKSIFKDIDSPNFKYPERSKDYLVKEMDFVKPLNSKSDYLKLDEKKLAVGLETNANVDYTGNAVFDDKLVFQGFKTASNKKVRVSNEALTKTKNIFKDIDIAEKFSMEDEISCCKNQKETPYESKDSASKREMVFEKLNELCYKDNEITNSVFNGFKMASNKAVTVSKDALSKTKNIFKDIDKGITNDKSNENSRPSRLHLRINEAVSNSILFESKHNSSEGGNGKSYFIGFQTASNKSVSVSKEALTKCREIFQDIDTEFTGNLAEVPDLPKDLNSNKEVLDSDSALPENKNICDEIGINEGYFVGFQTASNKTVAIAEEALAKSKKILQELLPSYTKTEEQEDELGYYTKHNSKEKVSDKPLTETMTTLTETDKISFRGFQTASKKKVEISEDALVKSRKVLQGIDKSEDFEGKEFWTKSSISSFQGFQTANNNKVNVSEEALAKSRKVFQDIGIINNTQDKNQDVNFEKNEKTKTISIFFGSKTATNRNVADPEEATEEATESKVMFSSQEINKFDSSNKYQNSKNLIKPLEDNFNNIIDTQVLNNFEQSLHIDDFHKTTPVKAKRSGSPILSCPRAKKRKKFEIPYSQQAPKEEIKIVVTTKSDNKILFDEHYKRNKKYTLKDLKKYSSDNKIIDADLVNYNFDNLLQFQFRDKRNDISGENITIDKLMELFLDSVNRKLVPNGWVENHLKLILWKLISYEVKFPKLETVCTVKNALNQLKFRYDRELYNAERPALRKIFERDDISTKTMVLCVVAIYMDGVIVGSIPNPTCNIELLITDGWYCIKATIDKMLTKLVFDGKITVGSKIVTNGAELMNCKQGVAPWEDTSAIRLKLSGNSTRRARWDARLGYHGHVAILSRLTSIKMDGGKASKLRVFITRVYPALYVEKFEDGSTVTRSERLEHLHQTKYESDRQTLMERLYEEVEKEFYHQESQDSEEYSDSGNKRTCLDSGTQIAKIMKKSNDPAEFRAHLTSSQTRLLEDHTIKRREKLLQDVQAKLQEKMEKNALTTSRNVVPVMKIRVAGLEEKNGSVDVTKGMMSIWKPNEAILEIIREGVWIDVMNVVPTGVRYSEIQISAGRQSIFSQSKYKEPDKVRPYTKLLKRHCFTLKDLAQNPTMATDYNEIDTVGLVFQIDPSSQDFDSKKQLFQNVYLADADKNMIGINFWGGLNKFGFENVLDTGQVIACTNLQKRAGNSRKNVPQYRVTEFSTFTKTPKNENARNTVEDLNKIFQSLDRRKFCEDCTVLKNNYSVFKYQNNENVSPYRPNNSDYNLSKNKIFINSPLARQNRFEDFNLTGLDFESTFKHTDTQDLPQEVLLRKKWVNEKINKLKMYGEPPPLSAIHIINKSRSALNNFKSPLVSKDNDSNETSTRQMNQTSNQFNSNYDSSVNATSVNNNNCTPRKNVDKSAPLSSPVLMNRTYVKSVNPMKLNFNVEENNVSDTVDHFAEDFDGSPPLSLD